MCFRRTCLIGPQEGTTAQTPGLEMIGVVSREIGQSLAWLHLLSPIPRPSLISTTQGVLFFYFFLILIFIFIFILSQHRLK